MDRAQWLEWLADPQQREYADFAAGRDRPEIERCACGMPRAYQWDGGGWCDGRCRWAEPVTD